jgi:RND family efflux transporter MFP subunit
MTRPFVAAIAALALIAGCAKHEPQPEPIRPVALTQVTTGGTAAASVFAGEVKPRHEADLGFRIAGKVIARSVDMGAHVRKGDVLARIDPSDVGLQAEAAKAAVAAARTELTFAQAEYDRYHGLFAQKFVSASALDQKNNAFETARAKLAQADAQLAVSRNQTAYATLVADRDGVVTAVNVEPGQVVPAGQAVIRLAGEDEREVAIAVPENRIGELKSAPSLAVALWAHPGKLYRAKVREIAPAVDAATRTFAVRVSVLDADSALAWGMTANVVVPTQAAADVVLLPLTAIYRENDRPAVWVYDTRTQQVALRPVTVAQYREDGVLVRDGLRGGELVVAAGVHKLTEGQKVRPYDGAATARNDSPATPIARSRLRT